MPNPGYAALQPQSTPLLPRGAEEDEEDDTRRRLFFGDSLDDAELATGVAAVPVVEPVVGRRCRVGPRTAAACTGLALVGLLATAAPLLAGRGASVRRSGHLSGATGLAEDSSPWVPRGLVIPPEAGSLPPTHWPQTPSPAPLPTLLTLAPLATLPPAPPVLPAPVTLAPIDTVTVAPWVIKPVHLDLTRMTTKPPTTKPPTTTVATTTIPPEICNRKADVPEVESELRSWELPDITKHVCFRMYSDQVKMTDHGKHTWNRNFCWAMMKHYGCLTHLGDKYTWAQAQETVSSLGGVPPASTSKFEPLEQPELCDRLKSSDAHNWTNTQNEQAARWFQENVAVYVLNLNSQQERWQNISSRLDELQILSDRVPGFNMSIQQDLADAYHEGAIPIQFNVSRAQEEALLPKNGMGGITGTVGCAAGHFRALARAARSNSRRPITLILEDDAYPDDDFIPQVWSMVREELPCGWDAVSLGSRCPFGKCISRRLSRVQPDGNEPEWRCRHGVNYGFQGVLYRTEAMEELVRKWKPVVFDESRPHCLDVDVALAAISDQVDFYAVPSLQALLTEQQEAGGSVRVKINGGHA